MYGLNQTSLNYRWPSFQFIHTSTKNALHSTKVELGHFRWNFGGIFGGLGIGFVVVFPFHPPIPPLQNNIYYSHEAFEQVVDWSMAVARWAMVVLLGLTLKHLCYALRYARNSPNHKEISRRLHKMSGLQIPFAYMPNYFQKPKCWV